MARGVLLAGPPAAQARSHADAVTNFVSKLGCAQVDQQLGQVKHDGDQGNVVQRDPVSGLEDQKQQGGKVGSNGLGDVSQIAGSQRFLVLSIFCHITGETPFLFEGKCIIKPNHSKRKAISPQTKALFTRTAFFARRISVSFAELTAEIVDGMEAAGKTDLLQRQYGFLQHTPRGLQAILDQRLHR